MRREKLVQLVVLGWRPTMWHMKILQQLSGYCLKEQFQWCEETYPNSFMLVTQTTEFMAAASTLMTSLEQREAAQEAMELW
jgi:hypothetical protein